MNILNLILSTIILTILSLSLSSYALQCENLFLQNATDQTSEIQISIKRDILTISLLNGEQFSFKSTITGLTDYIANENQQVGYAFLNEKKVLVIYVGKYFLKAISLIEKRFLTREEVINIQNTEINSIYKLNLDPPENNPIRSISIRWS